MITSYIKFLTLTFSLLIATGEIMAAIESDPVIASVENVLIRLSNVYQHIESLPLGDQIDVREQFDRFTDSVIKEEILFQYALQILDQDSEFRDQIKIILISNLIEKRINLRIDISDKLVEAYYQDHREEIGGDHLRVHLIPLNSELQCEALIVGINSIESFADLARKHSTDPILANRAGDLGYIMRHHNILNLGENLFSLPLHKTHKINNQDGCHLIWISEHVKSTIPTLKQVSDRIHQILVRQQETALLEALLETATENIKVKLYPSTNNRPMNKEKSDVTKTN